MTQRAEMLMHGRDDGLVGGLAHYATRMGTFVVSLPDTPCHAIRLFSTGPAVNKEPPTKRFGCRRGGTLRQRMLTLVIGAMCSASAMAGWDHHTGKGYTLCDTLHKRLNKYSYPDPLKAPNSCGWNAMLSYPGFTEARWGELDPRQHEELVFRLVRYAGGSFVKPGSEPRIRAETRDFIERGGRVQLWRTRLVTDFRNRNHPEVWTPPGLQNVVQLRDPAAPVKAETTALCPAVPRASWGGGRVFIVNDDLSDLNPDVGYTGTTLAESSLVLYSGRPHFVSSLVSLGLAVGRDQGSGPSDLCEFRYTHSPSGRK